MTLSGFRVGYWGLADGVLELVAFGDKLSPNEGGEPFEYLFGLIVDFLFSSEITSKGELSMLLN